MVQNKKWKNKIVRIKLQKIKMVHTRVVALPTLFLRIKELFFIAIMLPLKYNKNKNIVYKNQPVTRVYLTWTYTKIYNLSIF